MAKVRHEVRYAPSWPPLLAPINGSAGGIGSAGTLDAVGEKSLFAGPIIWEDGGVHDWSGARLHNASNLTGGTLRIAGRALSTASGPPVQDDGVDLGFQDFVNPNSGGLTATFNATIDNVATGDIYALVTEVTARVAGSAGLSRLNTPSGAINGQSIISSFTGGAWTAGSGIPCCTLLADDGAKGIFLGGLPQVTSVTTQSFSSASNPNEYGLAWTPTDKNWIGAMRTAMLRSSGAIFDSVLYEGTSALVTKSFNSHWGSADDEIHVPFCFPDEEFDVGTTYYLSMKPGATALSIYIANITAGDADLIGKGMMLATRNGGAWSTDNTKFPLIFSYGIVANESASGGLFTADKRGGMQ